MLMSSASRMRDSATNFLEWGACGCSGTDTGVGLALACFGTDTVAGLAPSRFGTDAGAGLALACFGIGTTVAGLALACSNKMGDCDGALMAFGNCGRVGSTFSASSSCSTVGKRSLLLREIAR